jgi:hypothetical protein
MSDDLPWGINRLSSMIGSKHTAVGSFHGPFYRAVPEPYHTTGFERLRATWWVLTGRAHAVVWPKYRELERALDR